MAADPGPNLSRYSPFQSDAPSRADLLYGMVLGLNIAARGGGLSAEVERLVTSAHTVIAGWR